MVGFWSRAIALSDFKNFWFVELYGSSRTTMSPSTFLYLVKKLSKLWSDFGRGRYIVGFQKFLNSTARAEQQCPQALFSISSKNYRNYGRILVEGDSISDFKNFWFVELYGSSRTTMSPSTFLYLVKKLSKLWSDFGRGR